MLMDLRALGAPHARGIRTTWLHSASTLSGEMIARVGWDCLVADMQHSMTDFGEMVRLLQVTTNLRATVLVRPPSLDPALIGRLLDAGASGIICPMVSSATEALALVAACRYPRKARVASGRSEPACYTETITSARRTRKYSRSR